jgi:hydroxymethylpyrimidine pyrophosphatase-like HAD family hydrolase
MVKMPPGPCAFFDIDDTLIIWKDDEGKIRNLPKVEVECRGIMEEYYINPYNLDYLKKLATRGHAIVVWSAGGADWAEAVCIALDIEHMVFAAMAKPTYYIDDIQDPKKILGRYEFYDVDGKRVLLEGK